MPEGWTWDPSLFRGTAQYYVQGRLPYPARLHDTFAAAADLTRAPRLLDVGCGPGVIALVLADLFTEVVGLDPDPDMLAEAKQRAEEQGAGNVTWVQLRAEELPAGLGLFRYATFAASFHWMERDQVARAVFAMLEPGGAFVHVDSVVTHTAAAAPTTLPHPTSPAAEIEALRTRYLGSTRRAGQGHLAHGTPSGERDLLRLAGFAEPTRARAIGRYAVERTVDDVVASVFSQSGTAPHLFGDEAGQFERDLRGLLADASSTGRFSAWVGDVDLVFYRRP